MRTGKERSKGFGRKTDAQTWLNKQVSDQVTGTWTDAAEAATGSTVFRAVLQDLAGVLHAEVRSPASRGWTLDWSPPRCRSTPALRRIRSNRCAVVPPRYAPAAALAAPTAPASPRRSTSPRPFWT